MDIKINFSHFVHWSALMLLPCLLLPGVVNAQEKAALDQIRITPFLGYRVGGEFEDVFGTTLELDEAQSYGLIFSKGAADALEFSISVQPTNLMPVVVCRLTSYSMLIFLITWWPVKKY